MTHLRVGRARIAFEEALDWTSTYLDAARNRTDSEPYAFPAYDCYEADGNDPNRLSDADLLAPVLLNVTISIRSYYALQAARVPLESSLRDIGHLALIDASDAEISHHMTGIYGLLDDEDKPYGIGGTKLSKIVHRKRPDFLVLHDKFVRQCYLGTDAVPQAEGDRPWAHYMTLISIAIRDDLVTQHDAWSALLAVAAPSGEPNVSLVRLLDIVAWHAGQRLQ